MPLLVLTYCSRQVKYGLIHSHRALPVSSLFIHISIHLKMFWTTLLVLAGICTLSNCQELITDPGVYGPELEVVHLYYDQFPTGKHAPECTRGCVADIPRRYRCLEHWPQVLQLPWWS
jgi:hypothetical protein